MKGACICTGSFFRGPPQKNIQANAWAVLPKKSVIGLKSGALSSASSLDMNVVLIGTPRAQGNAPRGEQHNVPDVPVSQALHSQYKVLPFTLISCLKPVYIHINGFPEYCLE